jgi:methylamine dehydrogenase accessory protein MauD
MQGWWAASYVVLWALVLTLGVIVVALARQIGTLHLRLGPRGALELDDEGPPLGEAPTAVTTDDITGERVTIGGPGAAQLLLFVSPGCHVCEQVLPSVPVIAEQGRMMPFVVTDVNAHETRRAYETKNLRARLVPSPAIVQSFDVPGTPYVVVLDSLGVVRAKGTVNNLEQMEGLVDSAHRRIEQDTRKETAGA